MDLDTLLKRAGEILEGEKRLIRLPPQGKAIFVGDTHGDIEATEKIIDRYLKDPYRIVFLGDYVDRGPQSMENIHTLLQVKVEHPEEVYLLAGNHEGYLAKKFYPANFWESLSDGEVEAYGRLMEKLPLAATAGNGILALHGALPDISSLDDIDKISWGSDSWDRMAWGDFLEKEIESLGNWGGRPQFGGPYFRRVMDQLEKDVLIRSHQPHAPQQMFNKRCVTIFTSHAYLPTRTVVIADLDKKVQTAKDLTFKKI
jgi:predicted phosphodiesterase